MITLELRHPQSSRYVQWHCFRTLEFSDAARESFTYKQGFRVSRIARSPTNTHLCPTLNPYCNHPQIAPSCPDQHSYSRDVSSLQKTAVKEARRVCLENCDNVPAKHDFRESTGRIQTAISGFFPAQVPSLETRNRRTQCSACVGTEVDLS